MAIEEMARGKLADRPTKALIGDLVMSGILMDKNPAMYAETMPTVRGWILDELRRRDEDAYWAWVEGCGEDQDAYRFFKC